MLQLSMHLVYPPCRSLLPSTVHNALALVNIVHIHTSGCTSSISAKPGSIAHFPTSTTSSGLQCLSVGGRVHLGLVKSCELLHVTNACIKVFHPSQSWASLGGCQLEWCSLKHKFDTTSVVIQVFKCSCGNKGREQHTLIPMGLLMV